MKLTTTQPDATPAGARLETPWGMTKQVLRVVWFGTLAVLALVVGAVAAVAFRAWQPLAVGLIMAGPFAFVAWLLWQYVKRTERMIYPMDNRPTITNGPTVVVEVTSSIKTPKGDVVKDKHTFDVGAHPSVVLEALRYMKTTGKTSRETVCKDTRLPQKPWRRLMDALIESGGVGEHGPTDEIDKVIAQVERQLSDL